MSTTSSAIGEFQIGISPIGVQPSTFDFKTTLISQYANSPILFQLIESFNDCMDQTVNEDGFFDAVWNIDTAIGFALDIWGRIVDINRAVPILTGKYFGLQEAGVGNAGGFNQVPFYSGQTLTQNYLLSDSSYRLLILAKALANICDNSIISINQLLLLLFPNRGACYIIDNGNMAMTYKFNFALSSVEQSIVVNSGVLPKPSGVSVSYSY